jgi:hypothetical protein
LEQVTVAITATQRSVQSMLDFLEKKPFAASFVGVIALGTCYTAGMSDWRIIALPLLAMLAYYLLIHERA